MPDAKAVQVQRALRARSKAASSAPCAQKTVSNLDFVEKCASWTIFLKPANVWDADANRKELVEMQKLMEEKEEKQKMCEKQEKIMETEQWQAFPSESQVKFGADTVNLSYF